MDSGCFLRRVDGYGHTGLRQAMEDGWRALAGEGAPFRSGDKILLKPNLLIGRPPEKAVNTHPLFAGAAAEFFADRGCRLFIGDSPSLETTSQALDRAGYSGVIRRFAMETASFEGGADQPARNRRWFQRLHLFEGLREFDHVINLPKLKTHSQMTLTLGVKNLFGCVSGKRKAAYHLSAGNGRDLFARLMLEIAETVNPSLTILDGVLAMEGNGPGLGDPRQTGVFAMSRDPLALDAVIGRLLGVPPANHPIVAQGLAAGMIGQPELIPLSGDGLDRLRVEGFRLPRTTDCQWRLPGFVVRNFKNWWTYRPRILASACTRCERCRQVCPVNAIAPNGQDRLAVQAGRCIRCFCCHEICPSAAIDIVPGTGLRLLSAIQRRSN